MWEFLSGTANGLFKLAIICSVGLIIEHFRPAERDQPIKATVFNFIC